MTAPEPSEDMSKSPTVDIQWIAEPVRLDANDGDIIECITTCSMHTGQTNMELSVRIVDEKEITDLNRKYRDKSSSTNVLSFDN